MSVKRKYSVIKTFSMSRITINMLEHLAEDLEMSVSGVIKMLIMDEYKKRYGDCATEPEEN